MKGNREKVGWLVTYLGDQIFGLSADLDTVLGFLRPADGRVLD